MEKIKNTYLPQELIIMYIPHTYHRLKSLRIYLSNKVQNLDFYFFSFFLIHPKFTHSIVLQEEPTRKTCQTPWKYRIHFIMLDKHVTIIMSMKMIYARKYSTLFIIQEHNTSVLWAKLSFYYHCQISFKHTPRFYTNNFRWRFRIRLLRNSTRVLEIVNGVYMYVGNWLKKACRD